MFVLCETYPSGTPGRSSNFSEKNAKAELNASIKNLISKIKVRWQSGRNSSGELNIEDAIQAALQTSVMDVLLLDPLTFGFKLAENSTGRAKLSSRKESMNQVQSPLSKGSVLVHDMASVEVLVRNNTKEMIRMSLSITCRDVAGENCIEGKKATVLWSVAPLTEFTPFQLFILCLKTVWKLNKDVLLLDPLTFGFKLAENSTGRAKLSSRKESMNQVQSPLSKGSVLAHDMTSVEVLIRNNTKEMIRMSLSITCRDVAGENCIEGKKATVLWSVHLFTCYKPTDRGDGGKSLKNCMYYSEMSAEERNEKITSAISYCKVANFEYIDEVEAAAEEEARKASTENKTTTNKSDRASYWEELLKDIYEVQKVEEFNAMGKGNRSRKQMVSVEDEDLTGLEDVSSEGEENNYEAELTDEEIAASGILTGRRPYRKKIRFGVGEFDWAEFTPRLKQKTCEEIKEYGTLFLTHIAEDITDSPTFSDGVPKEGRRIEDVKAASEKPGTPLFPDDIASRFPGLKSGRFWKEHHDLLLLRSVLKHGYGRWQAIVDDKDLKVQEVICHELNLPVVTLPMPGASQSQDGANVVSAETPMNETKATVVGNDLAVDAANRAPDAANRSQLFQDSSSLYHYREMQRKQVEFIKKKVLFREKLLNTEYQKEVFGDTKANETPIEEPETEAKVLDIPSPCSMDIDSQTSNQLPQVINGVPKGLRIEDVLGRIAVSLLIRDKVKAASEKPGTPFFPDDLVSRFPGLKSGRFWKEHYDLLLLRVVLKHGRRDSSAVALVPSSGTVNFTKQSKEDFVELFNWDKRGFPPCGLLNCGNSCFANVALQCLVYTRPLVAYLLEKGHRKECRRNDWCFLCEVQTHVERSSESQHPFSSINILSQLPNIGGDIGYGKQEDAHEFMRFAIDIMQSVCLDEFGGEKALHPSTQETTLIQHIFGGHLQSQDVCNEYVMAWKRLTVRRVPNILTIALKRFQSGRFGKLNKRVTFLKTLDLSPYMSEVGDGNDVHKLYAVVVHVDMLNASFFGHYICYTKDFCGKWYRIDDCKVMRVDLEEVLSQGAYMLLYSRPIESLTKGKQQIVQEGKPHAKQSVEFLTKAESINGICTSGSLSSDSDSQEKVSTCEKERTNSADVREDIEMVDSESSSSVPQDIEVHGNGYSHAIEETTSPVVHANRLVSAVGSSLSEMVKPEAYSQNSESDFPHSAVDENTAERSSAERLTKSSSESAQPIHNGVCEEGKISHDAPVGNLSSGELLDQISPVDCNGEQAKMETGKGLPSSSSTKDATGKLARRNSSEGKLKPLFPPGFLRKHSGNNSPKRGGKAKAPSKLAECASSYNPNKVIFVDLQNLIFLIKMVRGEKMWESLILSAVVLCLLLLRNELGIAWTRTLWCSVDLVILITAMEILVLLLFLMRALAILVGMTNNWQGKPRATRRSSIRVKLHPKRSEQILKDRWKVTCNLSEDDSTTQILFEASTLSMDLHLRLKS
ncbi:unnamed protein product [Camellia sinensis]